MNYSFEEITIRDLTEWVESKKIDLNPSYQRNFIWSTKDQSELVDTILKGFPLPSFFIYIKPSGEFEMVDGQQRTTTIYNFVKGKINSTNEFNKTNFAGVNREVLEYKLPIIFIKDIDKPELLNEFYVLINKKGKHLNIPEVNKSAYHDKLFLKLANEVLTYQEFIDLNLFTEATARRMNDRGYAEELLAYLQVGVKEKRNSVKTLLEDDISEEEYEILKQDFQRIIDKIHKLNAFYPLKSTRYKQKNDFYTLFSYINENMDLEDDIMLYQYRILLLLNKEDSDGRQFIRPSNEDCAPLKEYAINCVSQSNSKAARHKRLDFFNSILKNRDLNKNETLKEVLVFLSNIYDPSGIGIKKINGYELIDLELLLDE
ncbi:MAG TPA: DUF262 domain-containing protein [Leeuwenhoekiella sp.]|nr:DUF262 domain-containing protein [Leeuwenhoekiella sp.]